MPFQLWTVTRANLYIIYSKGFFVDALYTVNLKFIKLKTALEYSFMSGFALLNSDDSSSSESEDDEMSVLNPMV